TAWRFCVARQPPGSLGKYSGSAVVWRVWLRRLPNGRVRH
ncbi:uncharacterized protein METZ01_LOCUS261184, partial [marine metagenome]